MVNRRSITHEDGENSSKTENIEILLRKIVKPLMDLIEELKHEIQALKKESKQEIQELRKELMQEIQTLKTKLVSTGSIPSASFFGIFDITENELKKECQKRSEECKTNEKDDEIECYQIENTSSDERPSNNSVMGYQNRRWSSSPIKDLYGYRSPPISPIHRSLNNSYEAEENFENDEECGNDEQSYINSCISDHSGRFSSPTRDDSDYQSPNISYSPFIDLRSSIFSSSHRSSNNSDTKDENCNSDDNLNESSLTDYEKSKEYADFSKHIQNRLKMYAHLRLRNNVREEGACLLDRYEHIQNRLKMYAHSKLQNNVSEEGTCLLKPYDEAYDFRFLPNFRHRVWLENISRLGIWNSGFKKEENFNSGDNLDESSATDLEETEEFAAFFERKYGTNKVNFFSGSLHEAVKAAFEVPLFERRPLVLCFYKETDYAEKFNENVFFNNNTVKLLNAQYILWALRIKKSYEGILELLRTEKIYIENLRKFPLPTIFILVKRGVLIHIMSETIDVDAMLLDGYTLNEKFIIREFSNQLCLNQVDRTNDEVQMQDIAQINMEERKVKDEMLVRQNEDLREINKTQRQYIDYIIKERENSKSITGLDNEDVCTKKIITIVKELEEKREKEKNVVIIGLPEEYDDEMTMKMDTKFAKKLVKVAGILTSPLSVTRHGRKGTRPRIVKICFSNKEQASHFLRAQRKFYLPKSYLIKKDLTRNELEINRQLRMECLKKNKEENLYKYVVRNNEIVELRYPHPWSPKTISDN